MTVTPKVIVQSMINGQDVDFMCEPRQTLLEVLRDTLHLTGSKEGCGDGNCGACSVILNGVLVCSCLVLGVEIQGKELSTVEGLAEPDRLHPIQQSFLEHAAFQCGVCIPGFLMASKALLDKEPNPSEYRVREGLAGNLCRCTGYDKIIRAVLGAAETIGKGKTAK